MITTRIAKSSDVEWIFKECVSFSKTYQSKFDLTGDVPYAYAFLHNIVENHVVILSLKDGVRTGFIAGMAQPHHFNPKIKMLSELLWWVSPQYRGGGSGAKLFLEFVAYGKQNCDCITMTLEETTPISDASLAKRGFRLTEKAYLMECNQWPQ
jgi:RimJ/RimL family protein N-acetyltransferase